MGKFNSIITFTGKVGNMKGKVMSGVDGTVISGLGGNSRKDILFGKNFSNTRLNIQEFSGLSFATSKLFRKIHREDRLAHMQTFSSILKKMRIQQKTNAYPVGERPILFSTGAWSTIFAGHSFLNYAFENRCNDVVGVTPNLPLGYCDVNFSNPVTPAEINEPAGATHYKIIYQSLVLSDIFFNPAIKSWYESEPRNNGNNYESLYYSVSSSNNIPVQRVFFSPLFGDECVMIHLSIWFYQLVAGVYTYLETGSADKVFYIST